MVGTFNVGEEQRKKLNKDRNYEEAFASTFFDGGKENPNVFTAEKRLKEPKASWPKTNGAKNVWPIIKGIFNAIARRKTEGGENVQRPNLTQLILFTTLLGIRKRTVNYIIFSYIVVCILWS